MLAEVQTKPVPLVKVAVVGSRSFNNYGLMKEVLEEQLPYIGTVISGGAAGATRWRLSMRTNTTYRCWRYDQTGSSTGVVPGWCGIAK